MSLKRLPSFSYTFNRFLRLKPSLRRGFSTPPSAAPKDSRSRLRALNDRLPRFLRSYTTALLGAPGTHITSFLILHEITAIVPLFGLVSAFHYGNWLPDLTTHSTFQEGVQRFGRWLRKKGWVEDTDVDVITTDGNVAERPIQSRLGEGEKNRVRLVLEFATAYTITKALLPVRIVACVWATPWFARTILTPVGRGLKSLFGRK